MQMTKWEYVVINLVRSYGMQYRANGEKQAQWKDQPIEVVFNDMGKASFELVVYDGENYIFKRPRPPKTGSLEVKTGELKPLGKSEDNSG